MSLSTLLSCLLGDSYSSKCEGIIVALICIFLVICDVEHLSMYPLATCMFLENNSNPLLIFSQFFSYWVLQVLYIDRIKWSEVTQLCLTLCNPMDCNLPGSAVCGIFQARVLEWVAISFSKGSSWPRNRTQVSCIAGRRFTVWATREASIYRILTPYQIHNLQIFFPFGRLSFHFVGFLCHAGAI